MPKTEISAKIIADSISPQDKRITTFVLKYHRYVHAELMTHRVFSRNAASSRAIPIQKMLREVWSDPAIPVRWGKNGKGMQDHGVLTGWRLWLIRNIWIIASRFACLFVFAAFKLGLHKQIANRMLEPWAWIEVILTGTDFDNFFALRVHSAAQPEFQRLAYLMLCAYNNSAPKRIGWRQWHMPFGELMPEKQPSEDEYDYSHRCASIASARCARVSYKTQDGDFSEDADLSLYNRLVGNRPGHWSAVEHAATPYPYRCGPYDGWQSFRAKHEGENIVGIDLKQLQRDYENAQGIAN